MTVAREAYDWLERTFWNSLTKKLSSFLLLFLIDLGYLGMYVRVWGNVRVGITAESLIAA